MATGYNTGVENSDECGDIGSTGLKWCAESNECVRGATCPECDYEDELGLIRWDVVNGACCNTLATEVENCRLTGYISPSST